MRKKGLQWIVSTLICLTVLTGNLNVFSVDYSKERVEAATGKTASKAIKAYKKGLKNKDSVLWSNTVGTDKKFAVVDINKDGIYERQK